MRALVLATLLTTSCGGARCREVEAARTALTSRVGVTPRTPDVEVELPLARVNALIAEMIAQEPVTIPIDVPALGPIEARQLSSTVTEVVLQAGAPNTVRFEVHLRIDDPSAEVTSIVAVAEVTPVLARANGSAELSIGVGPENVLSLQPELGAEAGAKLGRAVARWLPHGVPQAAVDIAAQKLGGHLTGVAWKALRETLLKRLGAVTRLSVRLPDVPVARTEIHSTDVMIGIEIESDLPIRAGLAPATVVPADITVRIAGSAAAELANWSIDQKHAPQWYDRGLTPRADGEFRPRFDYVAGSHPFKVFAFQERGGCSFFRIGADATLRMAGDQLEVNATDQELEAQSANPAVEAVAWTKFFLFGWIDTSKRVAAHTRFTVGARTFETSVVGASFAHDELSFALRVKCCAASQ